MSDKTDPREENLERLLGEALAPPRLDPAARARIHAHLRDRLPERETRSPWLVPGAVVVAAVAAVVVFVIARPGAPRPAAPLVAAAAPRQETLADGTRLALAPGASVQPLGRRHVRLVAGAALLDVAKDGTPFVVDLPGGRAVVLGTRFVVGAEGPGAFASVLRGTVRLEGRGGAETLRAGEEGVLDGGAPRRRPAVRPSERLGWLTALREEGALPEPIKNGNLIARFPGWGRDWPLDTADFKVDVYVEDGVARVTIDQTFQSTLDFDSEGVLSLPLPPEAEISRLAMYVDGKLVEAGVVERDRGRDIYESIVYRRRDPALLEWMAGSVFRVRIFPIPARGEKRVLVSYTQSLPRHGGAAKLVVPIAALDRPVGHAAYHVRVKGGARLEVGSPSHDLSRKVEGDDLLLDLESAAAKVGDDLVVDLAEREPLPLAVSRFSEGGIEYSAVRVVPRLEGAGAHRPRRWVIAVDVSASRGAEERAAQAFVLDRFLTTLDESDRFALLAFDVDARLYPGGFARIDEADRAAIARFVAEQGEGVGGTDIGAALDAAVRLLGGDQGEADPAVLLIGDGLATLGEREPARLAEKLAGRALFVGVAVGDRSDSTTLGALATATSGAAAVWSPGDDLGFHVLDLVAALDAPRLTDVRAELFGPDGEPLPVHASATQLLDGEELLAVTRAAVPARRLVLTGRAGDREIREEHELPAGTAAARYLPRLWAQARVRALIAAGAEESRAEIAALGLEHFLLTPYTSLLVLENDEMYARFKVNRGHADDWARYAAPAKIAVKLGVAGPIAPAGTSYERVPVPLYAVAYGYGIRTTGMGTLGAFASDGSGWGGAVVTREVAEDRAAIDIVAGESGPTAVTSVMRSDDWSFKTARSERHASSGRRGPRPSHGLYDSPLPIPAAFANSWDARFDDLSEHVPALFTGEADRARERLIAAAAGRAPGSISAPARALVAEARRRALGAAYREGDTLLVLGASGTLSWSGVRDAGLDERAVADGETLVAVYPELGLAVRRRIGAGEPAFLAAAVPWLLPDADRLARLYAVELVGERQLRLVLPGETAAAVEIEVDAELRVVAIRRVQDGRTVSELRVTHAATEIVVQSGETRRVLRREAASEPARTPALDDLVVVDLPLALPAEARTRAEGLAADAPGRRAALDAALASAAAAGDGSSQAALLALVAELPGGIRPGEVVLAGRAAAFLHTTKAAKRILAALPAGHAVTAYFDACRRQNAGAQNPFDELAARPGLVGTIAALRAALLVIQSGYGGRARALDFIARRGSPYLRYALAHRFADHAAWQDPAGVVEVWAALLRRADPASADFARYGHAAALAAAGKSTEAAARFEELVLERLAAGKPPLADHRLAQAFWSSRRGQAGLRILVGRWREAALASGDVASGLALARFLAVSGQWNEAVTIAVALRRARPAEPALTLELARALLELGRPGEASAVLRGLLDATATPEDLVEAAELAAGNGPSLLAVQLSDRALAARDVLPLEELRAGYRRIVTMRGALADAATGAEEQDEIRAALAACAAWRALDPDNAEIDLLAAGILFPRDREAAWRVLSTVIERRPAEGAAWSLVAEALERQGQLGRAADLWAEAARVEPTDPTWRLRRAQALLSLGQAETAREILKDIAAGKWQERFANVVAEAKNLLE